MNTLVVYFSRTGHTQLVAEMIASNVNADLQPIEEANRTPGRWGDLAAAYRTLFGKCAPIETTQYDPAGYDLVILGSPVWMATIPAPMNTYLKKNKNKLGKVAFFCTEGSSGGERMFKKMEHVIGKPPLATLEITESAINDQNYRHKLDDFSTTLTNVHTTRAVNQEQYHSPTETISF